MSEDKRTPEDMKLKPSAHKNEDESSEIEKHQKGEEAYYGRG
jgi:hypothetical protein